ncbi:MAG: GAF domain-containing protein [Spirochaetota bacterium]|jgi:putative methionine-R-sulfoxide reductase with GAF domain|nr:GAF domain-containing protein [Spirochaetota bacterium]
MAIRKNSFFWLMLAFVLVLFGLLYFIGIVNLFFGDGVFLKTFSVLDFNSGLVAFFYLVMVSIFFVVMVTIMIKLTTMPEQPNTQDIIDQIEITAKDSQVSPELIKKITDISSSMVYRENEKRFLMMLESTTLQDRLDDVYYSFSQMTCDLTESQSPLELLEKAMYWGTKLSCSKRASILVTDRDKLNVYKTQGWKNKEDNEDFYSVSINERIAGKVAANKRFLVVNDGNDYKEFDFPDRESYETFAFVVFPVVYQGRTVAVLNFSENTRHGYYTVGEQEILRVIYMLVDKMYEHLQQKKKLQRYEVATGKE